MAVLEDIRQRSGLLLIVIGVAMLAFILGDFMQSQRSGFSGNPYIGEISQKEILGEDFELRVQERVNNLKAQNQDPNLTFDDEALSSIRDQIWNEYIQEYVMQSQFDELGIDIIDKEWFELIQGENVHSQIASIPDFQNPNTGNFDPDIMVGFLKRIVDNPNDPSRSFWIEYQDNMYNILLNEKYNSLVFKGSFVTSIEAKNDYNENIRSATFNYVSIPLNAIQDSMIQVSEKEIKKYYKQNINNYQEKEESNDIDFVQFLVEASTEDDLNTKRDLESIKEDFANHSNPAFFANRNSERDNAYFYFSSSKLFEDTTWNSLLDMQEGEVLGPYKTQDGAYRISRIIESESRPDSIQVRHIMMTPSQEMNLEVIDSILNACKIEVENGKDFGLLAQKYSQDKVSSIRGGELSYWISENPTKLCSGQQKLINYNFENAAFELNQEELKIVNTGSALHLIQVIKRSRSADKYKVGYIDFFVSPGDLTYKNYWKQATDFAGELLSNSSVTFDSLVFMKDYLKRNASKVRLNQQNVRGLNDSRILVQWMNNSQEGEVSKVLEIGNSFVVAKLVKKYKEGDIPLEDVREEVIAKIKRKKKYELVKEKIASASSLEDIAKIYEINVVKENSANMKNLVLDESSYEPELMGAVFGAEANKISSLIEGRNSFFVVMKNQEDEYKQTGDFSQQRDQIVQSMKSYTSTAAYNSLKEKANISDRRHNFY